MISRGIDSLRRLWWHFFGPACRAALHDGNCPKADGFTRIWGIYDFPLCRDCMEYVNG